MTRLRKTNWASEFSASACKASISAKASMMPVEGERSAAWQRISGSIFAASAASSQTRSLRPLRRPCRAKASSCGSCAASVATISLPMLFRGDAARLAIGVELFAAFDAGARLQAVFRVVETRVDHPAIVRRSLRADGLFGFQHENLAPHRGQSAGDREAQHSGADDQGLDFQVSPLSRREAVPSPKRAGP